MIARARSALRVAGLVLAAWATGCVNGEMPDAGSALVIELDDEQRARIFARSPVGEPELDTTNAVDGDADAIAFGKVLFFDERLSIDDETSCASCHDPEHGTADPRPLSEAIGTTKRHAPHLWNLAEQRWFFWDGRADSLWAQATKPIEDDAEMGNDRVNVVRTIAADDALRAEYEAIFGALPPVDDEARFPAHARPHADDAHPHAVAWAGMAEDDRVAITRAFTNLAKAIAAYEAKLRAPRTRFDTFVEGLRDDDEEKIAVLTAKEQRGLALFVGRPQCFLCHAGPSFSDREFHNIGLGGDTVDLGRFLGAAQVLADELNARGPYSDDREGERAQYVRFLSPQIDQEGQFKTPSLRNVARTAPYMHDGRFATLREVLEHYNELPDVPPVGHREETLLPAELPDEDLDDLEAFLGALTDEASAAEWLGRP